MSSKEDSPFGVFKSTFEPRLYWSAVGQFDPYQQFANMALRLLSIPASSAAVERSFSKQSLFHTQSRNRLSKETIEKAMSVICAKATTVKRTHYHNRD